MVSPVGEVGSDDGDVSGSRQLEGIDQEQDLHEVVVGSLPPTSLQNVDILTAHILQDLDVGLIVGEFGQLGAPHPDSHLFGHFLGQFGMGRSPEDPEVRPGVYGHHGFGDKIKGTKI